MIFNSVTFLFLFLPVTLIGFYALARMEPRFAKVWLVLASFVFYGYWNVWFVPLLVTSITFNYTIARAIFATGSQPRLQLWLMIVAIAADIGALCYYKYLFSVLAFLRVNTAIDIPFADVVLPLGISFFTFTQISYLVDIKQGLAKDRNLLDYLLFVTFFPHLIAGPILHNREMMPQFLAAKTYVFSNINFAVGITIFVIGLGKKLLIADRLAVPVSIGFSHTANIGLADAWYAAILYTFQLYFDFSGYTDMAIGLARMFNVKFPLNFNSPFKAASIIDFWQRWHMTLTRYTTMYVFTPMSLAITRWWMQRHKSAAAPNATLSGFFLVVVFPILITMLLLGVWHGAGLQFIAFGLLNGVYLAINHAVRLVFRKRKKPNRSPALASSVHASKVLLTCLAVLVSQLIFRSSSVESAFSMIAGLTGLHAQSSAITALGFVKIVALYAFVWFLPNTQQIMGNFEPALGKFASVHETLLGKVAAARGGAGAFVQKNVLLWSPNLAWACFAILVFVVSLSHMTGISPFLYFQF